MKMLKPAILGLLMACGCNFALAAEITLAPVAFDIELQPLRTALNTFARQSGLQVMLREEEVEASRTIARSVRGRLLPQQALQQLLEHTNLSYEFLTEKMVRISNKADSAQSSPPAETLSLAAATATPQATPVPAAAAERSADDKMDEIIVTAQKRSERLQDVPVPVSALDAEELARNGQSQLRDYFSRVPGLNFTSGNRGEPFIAIRGITTTPFANPTVGITIDDVPFGATSIRGGGLIAPDIDPSDLARIEVLRGPQGTLYGVSSLGGLIKFVTLDPSTEGFSARISTTATSIEGGDDIGYGIRGSFNIPLSDTLAMRASAFTRREPGFVDNRTTNAEDVNEGDASGGQLTGLWRPSDTFSARLSALYQERNIDASSLVSRAPGLGDLEHLYPSGSGWLKSKAEAYSATLSAKLGATDLTSISGYNVNTLSDSVDLTAFFGGILPGATAAPFVEKYNTRKFTQELRLVVPTGERLEWLFGGFYTDEKSPFHANTFGTNAVTGAYVGTLDNQIVRSTYEEWAVFADLTVRFTERFDVQFGGRRSDIRQTLFEEFTGTLWGAGVANSGLKISDDPFTYLVTPRFKLSPQWMAYARFASGYRAGGANPASAAGLAPPGWTPDETQNYELGFKGELLERRVSVDASLFHIDWDDIQLQSLSSGGTGYISNGGHARSRGVELTLGARPIEGLSLQTSLSWMDAQITEDFGPLSLYSARPGDRLPFTSRFSGNLSVEKSFAVSASVSGFVGASLTYVGDRSGLFRPGTLARQVYPSYTQTDLRAGIEFSTWSASAFVNNLGDKRGLLGGGQGAINPLAFIYIQPRTIGVSLTKNF